MSVCLITFFTKHDRVRAEEVFQQYGWQFNLIPPPIEVRTNCDYAFRFPALLWERVEPLFMHQQIMIDQKVVVAQVPLTVTDRLKKNFVLKH